jgi:threonyl-tRNA synthetase
MKLETLRHSVAHLMAHAVQNLYPDVKFGIGPNIDDGFYYDFDFKNPLSDKDIKNIQKEMKKILNKDLPFQKKVITQAAAKKLFKDQPYKLELIENLDKISIYQLGNFTDLCKGPHLSSTKQIPVEGLKLMKLAGAYWRGDEKNKMLTRIYGTAWENKKQLQDYLKKLEEAEKRDHRRINKKLNLYHIDENVGLGLPLWHPKGALIWRLIEDFWHKAHLENGYDLVRSPHIANKKLWEQSGHWNFYNDSMYQPMEAGQSLEEMQQGKKVKEQEQYLLKPMNCPFHVMIYKHEPKSYRDLPVRTAECGTVYRYEQKGELSGLTRVRGFTQDDAHIFCTEKQVENELKKVINFILYIFSSFGFKKSDIEVSLSLRDSKNKEKYIGSDKGWNFTQKILEKVAKDKKLAFNKEIGEAAFYGPKLDFKLKDSLGRKWQCSTLQFDFNLSERFDLEYVDSNGKKQKPYLLHRALFGSFERFIGLLIEHYAGAFPLWLSPTQIQIIPISDKHNKYAKEIAMKLKDFRVEIKDQNDSLSKKIRNAETQKTPYIIVLGDKEVKSKRINVRTRGKNETQDLSITKLIEQLNTQIEKKK